MSSKNNNGVNTQLVKASTNMDKVLLGGTAATNGHTVDQYSGYSSAAFLPFVSDWATYNLTTTAAGINGSGGTLGNATLTNIGGRIGRIAVVIRAPPICNTITNCTHTGDALARDGAAGAVLSIDTSTATTDDMFGAFLIGETVVITSGAGGAGTEFLGTVTQIGTNGFPLAISVTTAGSGYTAAADVAIHAEAYSDSTLENCTITVATDVLTEFPATNGRIVLPTSSGTGGSSTNGFASIGTQSSLDSASDAAFNSVISEAFGRSGVAASNFKKSVTGISISSLGDTTIRYVRAGGLALDSLSAFYCYAAPFYLIHSAIFTAGVTDLFTVTTATIMQYNAMWRSAENTLPARFTHTNDEEFMLKCDSMRDVEWVVMLPFPFCHKKSMALPMQKSQEFKVRVLFNGWRDVLCNSPTYNDNLTIAPVALNTVTVAAGTYTPVLNTYTVSGGRLGDARISMLSGATATGVVVPSTPLADSMFSAQLLVEHMRYDSITESRMRGRSFVRTVLLHRSLIATPITSLYDGTQSVSFNATLPTSYLYVESQRNSRALLNDRMNFSAPEDPLLRRLSGGGHLSGDVGANGAVSNHFFKSIRLNLEDYKRMEVDPTMASNLSLSAVADAQHTEGATGMLLAFSSANPYDMQPHGAASMTDFTDMSLVYTVNPAVLTDQQEVGGLPQDLFTASLYQYCYSQLHVDAGNGTMFIKYTS